MVFGALGGKRLNAAERARIRVATHIAYRPDIDGLRALAVLPVVFSHASIRGFAGGFVGVDVFFVISGYLITGILVRDVAIGRHSITEFYRRRVLRIFPALFAVLAATTVFACLSMLPVELMRYARSLGAATLFSSNALFYSESGYFDAVSTTKPLLHTWSLAVEEQFYILWPLAIAAIGAHRPKALKVMVALLCLVSFTVSVAFIESDPSATFYLLHTRAWELGLGAMLALTGNPIRSRWLNGGLGILGLAAILLAVVLYDQNTRFPGVAALLPCLGACLLIATGDKSTLAGQLLSWRPAVFIGQISYSLYMWHWPVVVFANIYFLQSNTDPLVQATQVGLAFILAVLSWRFIECPFRRNVSHWRTSRVLLGGFAATLAILCVAAALLAMRGLPGRYSAEQQAIGAYLDMDVEVAFRRGSCFRIAPGRTIDPACLVPATDRPVILLLGDSHAAHLWPGFAGNATQYEVLQATIAGCRPLLHPDPSNSCRRQFNDLLGDWIPRHRPALVVLSARWRADEIGLLEDTLDSLAAYNQKVLLVGPIPQYAAAVPRLLVLAAKEGDRGVIEKARLKTSFDLDESLRAIARERGVPYVSLIDMLCRNGTCRTLAGPGVPLQFDYGHLTEEGSDLVVRGILPRIDEAVGR